MHTFSRTAVTSIDLPTQLERIEYKSFQLSKIKKIICPPSLKYLSGFSSCESLTEVQFNNGLETIGEDAFGHTNINIRIPETVTKIEKGAFSTVRIEENGKIITQYIIIPKSVEYLGESSFAMGTWKLSFAKDSRLKKIDNGAFFNINFANYEGYYHHPLEEDARTYAKLVTGIGFTHDCTLAIQDDYTSLIFL